MGKGQLLAEMCFLNYRMTSDLAEPLGCNFVGFVRAKDVESVD